MSTLEDKEKRSIPCPGCHKPINATVYDLHTLRKVRCTGCGSELEITGSGASEIRHAIGDVEQARKKVEEAEKYTQRAEKDFKEAVDEAIAKADRHIKMK